MEIPSLEARARLEEALGHVFGDRDLLRTALTHPSYAQRHPDTDSNQRLEFLGDAILSAAIADRLFHAFPDEREGVLTHYRSVLSKGKQLAARARSLGLADAVRLGEGEFRDGEGLLRDSILEDALEALLGAVYLDAGWDAANTVIDRIFGEMTEGVTADADAHNPKGQLQERVQPVHGNGAIRYELLAADGPPHQRIYRVQVFINDAAHGEGEGSSKKLAEEAAARTALQKLSRA